MKTTIKDMNKIDKTYTIKATSSQVFDALTKVNEMEIWSGSAAKMDAVDGGKFELWGGDIFGTNQEISPSKITQDWYGGKWDAPSTVVFEITEADGGVTVRLVHTEIPEASFHSISAGWDEYYMGPIKAYLENKK